ncbi:hypothetical protein [Trueperella pyogenes]|uniref:hypothetical protein n=1 Tax=Trueperella pyogenes TaxID=1661 RepID=UPI003DA7F0D7
MAPEPRLAFQALTRWYARNARPLPWRETTDPWAILVCEIMSQQTPVARVEPVWRAWLKRWPSPADLAAASPAEILIAWDRMGYPRRALRLQEAAIAIAERGTFPSTYDDLLALPGVGPYTAAAVIAFAFGGHSVVLDTNIRRVLARWHGDALPAPPRREPSWPAPRPTCPTTTPRPGTPPSWSSGPWCARPARRSATSARSPRTASGS